MTKSEKIFLFVTVILISTIVYLFFQPILYAPSDYFFGCGGDGVKNYFTALYYLKFDSGMHFSAMNYPYGEQIVFTDNQPIFSLILKSIFAKNGFSENAVIATFNIAMLTSLVISAIFLYLICIHYKIVAWLACLVSVIITCLAPQVSRMRGHYGLSYVCFFPILWYLLIQVIDKKNNKLFPFFILVNFAFGITHLYYFAISALFIFATIVYLFYEDKSKWKYYLSLITATILPILLFQIVLKLTDTVTDRHRNPYGFYYYRSYLSSIFLPYLEAERNLIQTFFKYNLTEGEGRGFVGLAALFTVMQYFIFRISKIINESVFEKSYHKYVFAALMCLAFSFCLPFTLGLGGLTKVVPFLAQFRSLGRFNWAFYFVFTISAAIILNHFLERFKDYKAVKYQLIGLILLFWMFEAKQQIETTSIGILQYGKLAKKEFIEVNFKDQLKKINRSSSEFQAIMTFPFFNVGNEEWTNIRTDAGMFTAMRASYNLHLPVIESALSRTSISQSASLIQLMSNDLIKKTLLEKLNDKPILLIVEKQQTIEDEWRIMGKSKFLIEDDRIAMYELPVSAFKDSIEETKKWFQENKKNIFRSSNKPEFYSTQHQLFYEYDYKYQLKKGKHKTFTLLSVSTEKFKPNTNLEFSVWLKVTDAHASFPIIECKGTYKDTTTYKAEGIGYSTDIYKNYVRAKINVQVKDTTGILYFNLKGKDIIPGKFLLREVSNDIYQEQQNGMLMKNNFYLDDDVKLFDGFNVKK